MSVPAPDLSQKSIAELLQALSAGMAGSPMHQQATIMLQFRVAEQQAQAAAQQAIATEQLVIATQELGAVTNALVRATKALVFFGGATLLLTLVQVLKALGMMR